MKLVNLLAKLLLIIAITLPLYGRAEEAKEKVNINTAPAAELDRVLDGVGEKKAKAIVEYREKNGLFKTLDDFEKVPGIGPKTVEKNKDRIIFDVPKKEAAAPAPAPANPPAPPPPAAPAPAAPAPAPK